MMKIGNIVSNSTISVSDDFNVVKSMDEIIHGLPTLIVGWKDINNLYPNFDISNKRIKHNIYWTFKKTEKRDKYDEDLDAFITKTYKDLVSNIKYVFIDPIQYENRKLIKIIKKILKSNNIISYVHNDMVYIYVDKILFGVDLKLLNFIGLNADKIKNKIKAYSTVFLENTAILIEYKEYIDRLDNKVRYIPFLYSINNG